MHRRNEDALVSAHEIEPNNPDVAAALKQLKKNMEDYKWRTRNLTKLSLKTLTCRKNGTPNIHMTANGCSQHPHDQKRKLLYARLQYRASQSAFLASWTFALQEMLPKKCSLERRKRQKSLMRTNWLMNWKRSTQQMLVFSGEWKLYWESQFQPISFDFLLPGGGHHRGSIRGWSQTFVFFDTILPCDVKRHYVIWCPILAYRRKCVELQSCSVEGAECATACWSACSSWRANRTANGRANGLTPKTWQRSEEFDDLL